MINMGKRKGLPKKYAKMGFKRGWAAYKKTKGKPARTYTKPVTRRRKKPMAKKKYYRRSKNFLTSKTAMDGFISELGTFAVRKVFGGAPIYEAGVQLGIGFIRKNNTLMAQGIVKGVTAFLPNLNIGGGTTGGVR